MSRRNQTRKRRRYYLAKLGYPCWQVSATLSNVRAAWLWVLKLRGAIGGGYL